MEDKLKRQIKSLGRLLATFALLLTLFFGGMLYVKNNPGVLRTSEEYKTLPASETMLVELDDSTISQSGFINDQGVSQVIQNCTQCHSAKLVTQNRLSKEGWEATITWMQDTQNLWDLGEPMKELIVLTYLSKNYAPTASKGRRQNLDPY